MYKEDFALVYNKEWAFFSESLVPKILGVTNNRKSVLDLGCGTGNFLQKLEPYFEFLMGIDISIDMIKLAKKNCKKAKFEVENVTNFQINHKFDLITCNFDMINHLQQLKDWQEVFERAYNHLNDDGVFVFDFNTIFKMTTFDYTEHTNQTENYNFKSNKTKLSDNQVRLKIDTYDKLDNKVAEIEVVETYFEEEQILKCLKKAGFKKVKLLDYDFKKPLDYNVTRLFAVCKK